MSNPPKLNAELLPEMVEKAIDMARKGDARKDIAEALGIGKTTFYSYLSRGAAGEQPYATFAHQLALAEAEYARTLLAKIESADDWKAQAWVLERRFPKRFHLTQSHEVTGKKGGPIELNSDPAERKRRIDELLAKKAKGNAGGADGAGGD